MSTGRELRDCAFDLLENSSEQRKLWVASARVEARRLALRHGTVTAEALRRVHPVPPDWDPRILGAVFRTSEWVRVGFVSTPRAMAHGRPIAVWTLLGGVDG